MARLSVSVLCCLLFAENHSFSHNLKLRPKQMENSPLVTLLQTVMDHTQALHSFV